MGEIAEIEKLRKELKGKEIEAGVRHAKPGRPKLGGKKIPIQFTDAQVAWFGEQSGKKSDLVRAALDFYIKNHK